MFKKKNEVSEDAVMKALSTVIEPELHRDLVSLNMIRNLKVDGSDVEFTIMLTTPACPLKSKMENDSRAALAQVSGVDNVKINWDSNVPQDNRISNQIGQQFRNTIAVSSGKGGVGKSTVSVNLSIALAQTGARVGLLDADILGPNIPMMMGVEQMPPPQNRKLVPAENFGVKFISTAFLVRPDQPLIWRGPMLHGAIQQLLTDVDWGELDYLVVDLPPGTGDAQLTLAQVLPLTGALVITQPMQVAAADALRGLKTFEKLDVPIIGVIENMSGEFFGTGAGEKLSQDYNIPILGSVPLETQVRVGGDSGEPIVVAHPDSPAAIALKQIAQDVAARVSVLTLQSHEANFIPIQMIG
ncbi:MAG: Mrp/NBP35 family ATP-binding protein [Anaerolineales bacterium]|nr:Mrp/NBP35 family ATP-binding protein [Anaerolineales bacterium]